MRYALVKSKLLNESSVLTANTTFQDGFFNCKLEPVHRPSTKAKRRHISPSMKKKVHQEDDILGGFYDEDELPESERQKKK